MRVGARLRFAWVLAFVSPVVRCGTQSTYPADADADADASPKQCSGFLASECPAGERCLFRVDEGCAAKGVCLAVTPGICQQSWCTCRWDAPAPMCGPPGYVTTPVVSLDGDVCPSEYACGLACELCDVSGYSSTTMSAPTATPNACTPAQITGASTACFGSSATQQTCQAWRTANSPDAGGGSCVDCLFTLRSAAAWGAIVCDPTTCSVNTPGCVDLVLDQKTQENVAGGTGSCGDVLSAMIGCQDYACGACSQTGGTSSDFSTCLDASLNTECKAYGDKFATATQCAALQGDAAPPKALDCFPQTDADVPKLLDVFCGTGP